MNPTVNEWDDMLRQWPAATDRPSVEQRIKQYNDRKQIRFAFNSHGLGDVCHAAQALRLYIDRGHNVQIQVEQNKRFVWESAGIPIYDGPDTLPIHPYYYLPSMDAFWNLSLPDHSSSKIAGFFDVDVLPNLGSKEQVWRELCDVQIDATRLASESALDDASLFLQRLPKPIILLHSKGTNWQAEKSIPDATAFEFLRQMIDSFSGSIVTLDWDRRSPTLGHERIRPICPYWSHLPLDVFAALCMQSDLLIGVDSGPFHLAQWLPIKTLFVTHKIPPVRCCLPNPRATYLVPASQHEHWATRGPEWKFAEFHGETATVQDLVILACDLLAATSPATKANPMKTIDAASIPGKYTYNRVGHDQRQMELLPTGKIGEGAAGCERAWKIEQSPVGAVLTIYGEHGGPTCHLTREADGVLRGRWLHHERMPIELIPDPELVSMQPETVTFSDLVPITDDEPVRIIDNRSEIGHRSDGQPDAPVEFYVSIATLNCFDLLEKCIEAILASTWLPKRIYVIDNSGGRYQGHPSRRVQVFTPTHNLGAGGTANFILPAIHPAPAILINDDIEVAPNTLEAMVRCPDPVVVADGTSAFTCILIRDEAWEAVGPFDPFFWPAYCEDADWQWRASLLGIHVTCPASGGFKENGPSATRQRMTPAERAELNRHYDRSKEYYIRKWGGPPRLEEFKTPFNGRPQET